MIRKCDGKDPYLTMYTDKDGNRLRVIGSGEESNCDCGLVFDDVRRLVIWPHEEV